MAQTTANDSGSGTGFLAKVKNFLTDPMGIALGSAALLAIVVILYVVVF